MARRQGAGASIEGLGLDEQPAPGSPRASTSTGELASIGGRAGASISPAGLGRQGAKIHRAPAGSLEDQDLRPRSPAGPQPRPRLGRRLRLGVQPPIGSHARRQGLGLGARPHRRGLVDVTTIMRWQTASVLARMRRQEGGGLGRRIDQNGRRARPRPRQSPARAGPGRRPRGYPRRTAARARLALGRGI